MQARKRGNGQTLPFLEDAIAGIVEAERAVLSPETVTDSARRVSAKSQMKILGIAQGRAVAGGPSNFNNEQSDGELWNEQAAEPQTTNSTKASYTSENRSQRGSFMYQQRQPVHQDESQALLAARANRVIGVLTAIELLLPLAPWQRRKVSSAVVQSMPSMGEDGHLQTSLVTPTSLREPPHPITAHSARTAVSFLLNDCGMTHRQAAETIADHPWLLSVQSIRSRCSGLLDGLHLLNMAQADVAAVIAAHPPALLADIDKDLLPVLDYLTGLGFTESEAAALIRAAPKLLLGQGATERLSGNVAFWVGRGMPRTSLRSLLSAAPEVTSMNLRLLQLKADWLMDHAGFTVKDFAQVPAALQLPLAGVIAPRLAFARHRGFDVPPPSKLSLESSSDPRDPPSLSMAFLLSCSEADFLRITDASDAEYRGFEAVWRDTDLRRWMKSRFSGTEAAQYEGMEWLAEEEMTALREMHDRHLALRELASEQQVDREKEWESVWKDWKKTQLRRDQLENWTRRAKKRREEEALRRSSHEMAMLVELDSLRRPGMCTKSPYCNRHDNHPGVCNQKLALNFDTGYEEAALASGGLDGVRGSTVNEIATRSEIEAGMYLVRSDIPRSDISTDISTDGDDVEGALGGNDGPSLTRDEIEAQPVDAVLQCAAGIESLLRSAPHGVLTHRTVNAWAERHGFSRPCIAAAKGVLAATGTARVVVEPNWNYHKVAPKAWQLVPQHNRSGETDTTNNNNSNDCTIAGISPPPRLTRSAGSVVVLSSLVLRLIDSIPEGVILRSDLRAWAETRWKGSSKHLRAAVAGLVEQGLLVQRRRRGITSGPMEVARIDLDKYLNALPPSNMISWDLAHIPVVSGGDPQMTTPPTPTSTSSSVTASPSASTSSSSVARGVENFEISEDDLFFGDDVESRDGLLHTVYLATGLDYKTLENQPVDKVHECAAGLVALLRDVPQGLSHRVVNSWATRNSYSREMLAAAKALLFCSGQAALQVDPVVRTDARKNGSRKKPVPKRTWVEGGALAMLSVRSERGKAALWLAKPMLEAIRSAPGGFMEKKEVKNWVKSQGNEAWAGVAVINLAVSTLVEAGCVVELTVPNSESEVKAGRAKHKTMVMAVDLSAYMQDAASEQSSDTRTSSTVDALLMSDVVASQ